MIRAVVFDCDGVLVDSEPLAGQAWIEAMVKYGYTVTEADIEACLGITEDAMHAYLSERVDLPPYETVITEVDAIRFALFDAQLEAFPDAVETVRALALEGIPLAVASSSRRFALEHKLARFDLARYFDAIVAGDDVANGSRRRTCISRLPPVWESNRNTVSPSKMPPTAPRPRRPPGCGLLSSRGTDR